MHCLCAVNASGGGGVIAGLAVFAVEAGGVVGVVELGCVLPRDRAFAGGFRFPVASMAPSGPGDPAVPFYLRVF